MQNVNIKNIFDDAVANERQMFVYYTQMQTLRRVRKDLECYARNRKKDPRWEKFASLMAQGYSQIDVPDGKAEEELSEVLGISHPLIMRDYMTGDARPAPERAAKICGVMAEVLMDKEADIFVAAVNCYKDLRAKKKRGGPKPS